MIQLVGVCGVVLVCLGAMLGLVSGLPATVAIVGIGAAGMIDAVIQRNPEPPR